MSPKSPIRTLSALPPPTSEQELTNETGVAVRDPSSTSLVRYVTVQELMQSRVAMRNRRIELLAMWALLLFGIYLFFQTSGNQNALKDSGARQEYALAVLTKTLGNEDQAIKGVVKKVEGLNQDTTSELTTLEGKTAANDRATRQLKDQLNRLESELAASATARSGTSLQHIHAQ